MSKIKIQNNIKELISIHEGLSSADNLKPSPKVDSNFFKLVDLVDSTPRDISDRILDENSIQAIHQDFRRIASKGEGELEKHWAQYILDSNDFREAIKRFPYIGNYEKMMKVETQAMKSCDIHNHHKVLFIGSGPLPLSSIILAERYGYRVDNLDIDITACELSSQIIAGLGLSDSIKVINKSIFDMLDFSEYDCVFIAALVGENENDKREIIEHVTNHADKGTHIVLRSVKDLGTLLYPEITDEHLKNINVLKINERQQGIINNIIVGKIK